jgi:RNA polymerase sigma factor (sigma-70 family)
LVISIANKLAPHLPPGMEMDDLIQEGFLALAQAAQGYDPARGCTFATYASPLIWSGMRRATERWARTIHLPFNRLERLRRLRAAEARARREGEPGTPTALARLAGIAEAEALELLALPEQVLSLEWLWQGEEWSRERPRSDASRSLTEEQILLRIVVRDAVDKLACLQRQVTILRYGLDGGGERPFRAIGRRLGLSREYARDLEAAARVELRHRLADLEE